MRYFLFVVALSLFAGCAAWTHGTPGAVVAPGISVTPMGMIHINDITAEVYQFDTKWLICEQHDVFKPNASDASESEPGEQVVSGVFQRPAGPFSVVEHLDKNDDGVAFSANLTSDTVMPSNEISVSFSLPVKSLGGKTITVDQQLVSLPADPAKPGQAVILEKDGIKEIDIPEAEGTLTLTGDLSMHLQDDRQWGDQRYALRLYFTPRSGQVTQSKIEFQMKWKPANG